MTSNQIMFVEKATGLITPAQYFESPNQDERPEQEISLLVIHCMSLPPGQFGGSDIKDLFLNRLDSTKHRFYQTLKALKVSSHLVILRDGQIWQFAPFSKRAWHAGESNFEGRSRCNDFSIGIELEGMETVPYTEAQYQSLAQCTFAIMQAYTSITKDRIVGHEHISPQRKTDPGPTFDWHKYFALVDSKNNGANI